MLFLFSLPQFQVLTDCPGLHFRRHNQFLALSCLPLLSSVPAQLSEMTAKIFSGLLVDSQPDWSLRVEQGVLVVRGDRIVERAATQELQSLADRLYSER